MYSRQRSNRRTQTLGQVDVELFAVQHHPRRLVTQHQIWSNLRDGECAARVLFVHQQEICDGRHGDGVGPSEATDAADKRRSLLRCRHRCPGGNRGRPAGSCSTPVRPQSCRAPTSSAGPRRCRACWCSAGPGTTRPAGSRCDPPPDPAAPDLPRRSNSSRRRSRSSQSTFAESNELQPNSFTASMCRRRPYRWDDEQQHNNAIKVIVSGLF